MATEKEINKTLKYSIYDGAAVGVMDGFTASYITPFAIVLNASISFIAALNSIPQLVGSFFQLFSVKLGETYKDGVKLIVKLSFMHALLWLPLLLIPYLPRKYSILLIFIVAFQIN